MGSYRKHPSTHTALPLGIPEISALVPTDTPKTNRLISRHVIAGAPSPLRHPRRMPSPSSPTLVIGDPSGTNGEPGFTRKDVGNDGERNHRTDPLSSNSSLWHGVLVRDAHPKDSSFQNPPFGMIHFRSIQHETPLSEADMCDGFSTLFAVKHPEQKGFNDSKTYPSNIYDK